jgi:hypothetical protein
MSKAKIAKLEKELNALKNSLKAKKPTKDLKNTCVEWVKAKRGAKTLISESIIDYKRVDGSISKVKALKFDNGETYNVGSHKFWKVK